MATRYIDALDVTIADSFVVPSNKVESGHGEAKLYVGHRTSDTYREFFGPTGFQLRCRLRKSDLLRFLAEMRTEYFHPSFSYRDSAKLKNLWVERKRIVEELPTEEIEFFVEEQSHLKGPRGYVNSDSSYYEFLRLLPLPNTSRLKIVKLEEDSSSIYEFKLMPDFDGYTSRPFESEVEKEIKIGGFNGSYKLSPNNSRPHMSGLIELPEFNTIQIDDNQIDKKDDKKTLLGKLGSVVQYVINCCKE
jgi:hypothetical protein